ncbi:hypothetical protein JB92DRAFT_3019906 [Gautieria morchelliformis]|nr:hypothetical protein JB92DRAFT_3019906 [Gautieria morchelliformis]
MNARNPRYEKDSQPHLPHPLDRRRGEMKRWKRTPEILKSTARHQGKPRAERSTPRRQRHIKSQRRKS